VGEIAVLDEDGIDDRAGDAEDAEAGGLGLVGEVEEIGFEDLEIVAGGVRGVGDADGGGVGAERAVEDDAVEGEISRELDHGVSGAGNQHGFLGQAAGRPDSELFVDNQLGGFGVEAAIGRQFDDIAGCRGGDSGSEAVRARRHLDDRLGRQKGSQRSQQNQQ